MYQIRTAAAEDMPRIEEIYAWAREFMEKSGNPSQWGKTHPPTRQLWADIGEERLYVVTGGEEIHGVFYFAVEEDPTYLVIEEGSWGSEEPYGVIHRIASDGSGGIFSAALDFCRGRCAHIRIDTHRDNRVMQHVLEKHGFQRRGVIYVADGSDRLAYELL